ncbi:squalene monooxygenase-like [Latimeria chalumnae]|uniref:squalene monooxygenase-like n=1 Tax=Latimeria chalumnae TaxID=7897 RepID=UPI0003C0FDDD|nr:PREDICTED: squalene monooxygenase-like [Latimeria chalumnae]|eukprot:XP_005998748.1 PREDICTED: squalene monooxygenase-like [Latimeria chalumnae]
MWTFPFISAFTSAELMSYATKEVLGAFLVVFSMLLLLSWHSGKKKNKTSQGSADSDQSKIRKVQPGKRTRVSLPDRQNNPSLQEEPEVIIVGAGVLGAAMAALLARDGRKVVLIERDMTPPDRFAGELLQPGGLRLLKEMKLEDTVEGLDAQILYGFLINEVDTNILLDITFPEDEKKEVICGRTLHNGRFVNGLRKAALAEPNVKLIEGTASTILQEGNRVIGVEYKDKETGQLKEVYAGLTVVADGLFSNFRKTLGPSKYQTKSHYAGFVIRDCPAFRKDKAEYILANKNLLIVYQISTNETRVLVDIKGEMPKNLKEYMTEVICPQLPDRIRDAFLNSVQTERLRSTPVGYMKPSYVDKPGVLMLGDAYNVRNPVTGAGMSVALNDLKIWRSLLKNIPDLYSDGAMNKAKKKFHWLRKRNHSFVINVLAEMIYDVFSASEGSVLKLRKAYFDYFQVGNPGTGPVEMLSILSPDPKKLMGHFLGAALHAIRYAFKTEPWYLKPRALFKSSVLLFSGMSVIFPVMFSEMQ